MEGGMGRLGRGGGGGGLLLLSLFSLSGVVMLLDRLQVNKVLSCRLFFFFFHSQTTRAYFFLVLHSQTSTSMDGGSSQSVPFVQDDIIGQKTNCP